jgi:hypothetical protein
MPGGNRRMVDGPADDGGPTGVEGTAPARDPNPDD